MFWFSVPSPYTVHEPRLGLFSRPDPVISALVATLWSGMSAVSERITAIRSTCFASSGKISDTSMPDWPCFVKRNGEPSASPAYPEIGLPSYRFRAGFGSHVSTVDGPPDA